MVEYRRARAEEAADILDFINYVFSQAHYPHDFRKFNPKMYASGYPFWKEHYVAVEDGRIKATLSITKGEIERGGEKFTCGHVGQVSVHPYARGGGHMKALMRMADEDMQKDGWDFAELNGLRQRYEYFGYTQGGMKCFMTVTPTNIRHVLKGAESRMSVKERTDNSVWERVYDLYDENGKVIGKVGKGTLQIGDLSRAPEACDAFFRATGETGMSISAAPYETERIRAISAFCEDVQLKTCMQYRVYHFEKVLRAGLALRAQAGLLPDGVRTVEIDGQAIEIRVEGGRVTVGPGRSGEGRKLTAMQAQEMMFSAVSPALYPDMPAGWFPISL